jgi:hypothetical protein
VASGKTRVLTWQRKGIAALQWSHAGTQLAFLAEAPAPAASSVSGTATDVPAAGKDAKPMPQIFVMSMDGGDPRQITQAPRGVEDLPGARTTRASPTSPRTPPPTPRRWRNMTAPSR